jgi:hypothetical protein
MVQGNITEEEEHESMRLYCGKASEILHLLQLGWPSFADAPSGMEEGVLKLAALSVACGSNKTGW